MKTKFQTTQTSPATYRRPGKSGFAVLASIGVFPILILALASVATVARADNPCQKTSQAAMQSCRSAAESDYQLALGTCDTLADPAARKACRQQALADLKAARADCKDQLAARRSVCDQLGGARYDPVIAPSNFVSGVTNPLMPLVPGTTFYYLGPTPQGFESNVVSVTHNTRLILGVTCIEVHDVSYIDGELQEDTLDWFAQDIDGNVWYFGENTKELEGGLVVSLEGSWTAGVDGAKPGIAMKAQPAIGDFYRQEFLLGTAEDIAEVQSLTNSVTVPYGPFDNCVKTEETTPLEPDALEHKFYATGVGLLLTVDEETGDRSELVKITTGN
jgi:hypothetical protein